MPTPAPAPNRGPDYQRALPRAYPSIPPTVERHDNRGYGQDDRAYGQDHRGYGQDNRAYGRPAPNVRPYDYPRGGGYQSPRAPSYAVPRSYGRSYGNGYGYSNGYGYGTRGRVIVPVVP